MEKREIEIKLLFTDKEEIISLLKPRIKFLKILEVKDSYYGWDNSEISNKDRLIRLRKIKGKNAELTLKGRDDSKNNVLNRLELSTVINSPKIMAEILKNIGLRILSEHESKKEYWLFDGAEIVFAYFTKPAKLQFMEIEADSERKIEKILDRLQGKVKNLDEKIFRVFDVARGIGKN